mmetsp:Transcript_15142/g.38920  ORF Transcript_15142/g.38920 Transcript_15142/m.38920 type:complete len:221 (-) Transcript_15142:176-838(-)
MRSQRTSLYILQKPQRAPLVLCGPSQQDKLMNHIVQPDLVQIDAVEQQVQLAQGEFVFQVEGLDRRRLRHLSNRMHGPTRSNTFEAQHQGTPIIRGGSDGSSVRDLSHHPHRTGCPYTSPGLHFDDATGVHSDAVHGAARLGGEVCLVQCHRFCGLIIRVFHNRSLQCPRVRDCGNHLKVVCSGPTRHRPSIQLGCSSQLHHGHRGCGGHFFGSRWWHRW